MSNAKPILGEDTIFGRLYYRDEDYAALEAENARLVAMLEDWEADANLLEKERDAARAQLAAIQSGVGEQGKDHNTHLPPVGCPLLIRLCCGSMVRAERTAHITNKLAEYEVRLEDGTLLKGRSQWTYP